MSSGSRIYRRTAIGWLAGASVLSLLAACASPAPQAAPPSAAGGTSAAGASTPATTPLPKVSLGIGNQINNLDLVKSSLIVYEFDTNVLTSGLLYRLDIHQKPYPELVDTSDVSADGLTVSMKLKPNLSYSDGTPVKASDALPAWTRLNQMEGAQFFTPIDALTAPDDMTILWKLKTPYPDLEHVLGYQYLLMHPGDRVLNDPNYWNSPVSAGPYMLSQWKPGTNSTLLQANPKYVLGPMMAQQLELVTVTDTTSRTLQLTNGTLDFAFELPFSATNSLGSGARPVPHPQGGTFHVTINTASNGPLGDARVRQAMSLAIDRDAVSQKAFYGVSAPNKAVMYQGVPEWSATLPNDGKQDLEGAKSLLAQTPYASGFEFTCLTFSSRAGWPEATLLLADDWKKIGITANVQPVEDAVVNSAAQSGNFDAMWTGTVQSPINMLKIMYVPGGGVWDQAAHYNNQTVTDLLNQAQIEPDDTKRQGLVQQVEKIVLQDMPHIPVCERALLLGSRVPEDIVSVVDRQNYIRVKTVAEMQG
ncbi:MAG: ABC transporter substrate-binding protein [Chloroflexi bacterium]|nr:ABC transporter substrate-binding protein [Chloroflexota bacterium]